MKWAEVTIHTTQEATEAVAHIFVEAGAAGVIIDDPQLIERYRQSAAWDYCSLPVSHETVVKVIGYLPILTNLQTKLAIMRDKVEGLADYGLDMGRGTLLYREVMEEDWANSWKIYYHSMRVGRRLVIRPSWEAYTERPGDINIELDPGMAFGTGTHATTMLCMEAIENYLKPGLDVIDVGTGSGILAITAAKLGAGNVLAIDFDPVAVKAAAENVMINDVQQKIQVRQGDLLQNVTQPADMIIANIVAGIIIDMAPDVAGITRPGGLFIASGIIDERLAEVKQAICQAGLHVLEVTRRDGWAVIVASRG